MWWLTGLLVFWYFYNNHVIKNDEIKKLKNSRESLSREIERLREKLDRERQEKTRYELLYLETQPEVDFDSIIAGWKS